MTKGEKVRERKERENCWWLNGGEWESSELCDKFREQPLPLVRLRYLHSGTWITNTASHFRCFWVYDVCVFPFQLYFPMTMQFLFSNQQTFSLIKGKSTFFSLPCSNLLDLIDFCNLRVWYTATQVTWVFSFLINEFSLLSKIKNKLN